ncbi:DUF5671 domain-containing protein [Celeribacter ethanolicus]|uniref:DUF5671 domain-containing protein n=1 Tax=Celeribacter ethanolicus TaxID=1758178 RepID=A0A291GBV3_9RHOB|nr:DUF5671 domain-containing protein [Celeribacter ethanolicus]ATG48023.1 hypothetical protein CEW89_10895 [Celeribacter ethanolicus]TNE68520.1 MAG: hypothetical protein EP336_04760 [Paracoccaceae bacterium]
MKPADQLAQFVREALISGRSRDEITMALSEAGWARTEVEDALATWAESSFTPPIPRPRPYVSAKEAFFYALMFVALGMTAWHIVDLGFDLIERWMSDMDTSSWSNRSMRWSISALIVFFPLFMLMQRTEIRSLARDPSRKRSAVRKWFGYIALFLSSLALLGDVLSAIYALLNGDMTLEFILKLLLVGAVAGTVFGYFQGAMKDAEDGA